MILILGPCRSTDRATAKVRLNPPVVDQEDEAGVSSVVQSCRRPEDLSPLQAGNALHDFDLAAVLTVFI